MPPNYPAMPPVDYISSTMTVAQLRMVPGETFGREAQVTAVEVPPEQARTWCVTLQEASYTVDAGGAGIGTSNGPPINWGSEPLLAVLQWGDKSIVHRAEVDWGRGRSIHLHAHYIAVSARVADDAAIVIAPARPGTVFCGGSIAPSYDNGNATAPTRSMLIEIPQEVPFFTVRIPPYARLVRWYPTSNTALADILAGATAPIGINFVTSDDLAVTNVRQYTPDGLTTSPLTWPNERGLNLEASARFLTVVASAGTLPEAVLDMWLEFELDLG